MNVEREDLSKTEEEPEGPRRGFYILASVVVVVALGYLAVILVGGEALRRAPLGEELFTVRQRIGEAIAPERPSIRLRPLEPLAGTVNITPSPIVARPSPSVSPSVVAPAPDDPSTVTFSIEYENTTAVRLTGVRITDRIPSGAAYLIGSPSPSASFDGAQLIWNIGTLSPGQKGTVSFQVTTRKDRITNKAVMTSNEAPASEVETSAKVS